VLLEEEEEERNRITSSLAITLLDPPEEGAPVSFSEATTASTKRFKDSDDDDDCSDGDDFTNVFSFNKRNADGHILLLIVEFSFSSRENTNTFNRKIPSVMCNCTAACSFCVLFVLEY
jgi:hypothetical protein